MPFPTYLEFRIQGQAQTLKFSRFHLFCAFLGVRANYGTGVGKLEWLEDGASWLLTGLDGQTLGHFEGVVASDKLITSPIFRGLMGQPPPLGRTAFLCIFMSALICNN